MAAPREQKRSFFLSCSAGEVIPESVYSCPCVQSLRGRTRSRTVSSSAFKSSSERGEPDKGAGAASCCAGWQGEGRGLALEGTESAPAMAEMLAYPGTLNGVLQLSASVSPSVTREM